MTSVLQQKARWPCPPWCVVKVKIKVYVADFKNKILDFDWSAGREGFGPVLRVVSPRIFFYPSRIHHRALEISNNH